MGRAANGFVYCFDQPFSAGDVIQWMLGIPTGKISRSRWQDVAVIRFDENVRNREVRIAESFGKVGEIVVVAFNSTVGHAADGKYLRQFIPHEDIPVETLVF